MLDVAHALPPRSERGAFQDRVGDGDPPLLWREQPNQKVSECRLAGTRWPGDADKLTGFNGEADALNAAHESGAAVIRRMTKGDIVKNDCALGQGQYRRRVRLFLRHGREFSFKLLDLLIGRNDVGEL